MFPPVQCSKSSYFTQWLISEYLNRINNEGSPTTTTTTTSSKEQPQQNHNNSHNNHNNSQKDASGPTTQGPPTQKSDHHTLPFSKHLFPKHLFFSTNSTKGSSSSNSHHNNHQQNHQNHHHRPNNNEYNKNGLLHASSSSSPTSPSSSTSSSTSSPDSITIPKNIEFIQLLALNALEFTAPIYSFINKKEHKKKSEDQVDTSTNNTTTATNNTTSSTAPSNNTTNNTCKCPSTRSFVQLSGHPGSFAPAGPNTVWKKMPEEQGPTVCASGNCANKDTCGSLKELLQTLVVESGERIGAEGCSQQGESSEGTTAITVFFNSEQTTPTSCSASSSSSSSSSSTTPSTPTTPPLLPPQIYNIPTHLLPNECQVYRRVNSSDPADPITRITPKYVTETCYNSQMFLELEDLLTNFSQPNPTIMDIKLGTRTFLESEVKNSKPRPDLYEKLIAVDRTACTESEHAEKAVTKLTYMLFREKQSSSNSLGFRVEGVKIGEAGVYKCENQIGVNFKCLRDESEISNVFTNFCKGNGKLARECLKRLEFIRATLEESEFFMSHEVIGSSLLFIHDDLNVGVWMIDFAKTFTAGRRITHRDEWVMGNREDGVLAGVDNIIRIFSRSMVSAPTSSTPL